LIEWFRSALEEGIRQYGLQNNVLGNWGLVSTFDKRGIMASKDFSGETFTTIREASGVKRQIV